MENCIHKGRGKSRKTKEESLAEDWERELLGLERVWLERWRGEHS